MIKDEQYYTKKELEYSLLSMTFLEITDFFALALQRNRKEFIDLNEKKGLEMSKDLNIEFDLKKFNQNIKNKHNKVDNKIKQQGKLKKLLMDDYNFTTELDEELLRALIDRMYDFFEEVVELKEKTLIIKDVNYEIN